MSTEVKHGPDPKFDATLSGGVFACTVEGHYTTTDHLAAAGVTDERWESARPAKRVAELLALRTAFVNWFIDRYVEFGGGTAEDAIGQIDYVCRMEKITRDKE